MSTIDLKFGRRFQLWSYTVSHHQLLLRSTKSPREETRVDVLFKDVWRLSLPTLLEDVSIAEADDAFIHELSRTWIEWVPGRYRVFVVHFRGGEGFIVAGALFHNEDREDYDVPSPLMDWDH
jgi:hypothetical protein